MEQYGHLILIIILMSLLLRFNRRTLRSRGKLFYRLVLQAAPISPVTADDIRGGTIEHPEP